MSSEKGRTATKRRAPPEINKVKRSVPQVWVTKKLKIKSLEKNLKNISTYQQLSTIKSG
ncbi:hypothetical protein P4U90_07600 [Cytobacillus kochii]|uniref:hypothetical protein n=1 Tax=Cytobacillus kochii TaxID=859143 RepID=UPI002E1AA292|nr:hypothetical protein [Cytobacillus kochii]